MPLVSRFRVPFIPAAPAGGGDAERLPLGPVGKAAEIAEASLYLIRQSSSIGRVLVVDGERYWFELLPLALRRHRAVRRWDSA